ncbi:MAG: DUF1080 domain-containing protein [Phycisphaerae bacterium]|nr:DUF1080 domain-containing protein [Phycisphaerae bacterium]
MFARQFTLALVVSAALGTGAFAEPGFQSIFDGKTLDGWNGDPKFWSVKDGAITGQTTKENPTKGNTFIIWNGTTADFELKLQYKIVKGNSGIQYRSFKVRGADEWRIGGYQADFEAGKTYSGILYGEKFRGILARRGEKTVIGDNHKPKVVGKVGESAEIQAKIKHEDWNDYHIIAKGFNFIHKINGVTTVEVTDEDTKMRRADGLLALQLHAGPAMTVQFRNIRIKQTGKPAPKKKIVFVAGRRSHGKGSHEHRAGCMLLAHSLTAAMPSYEAVVVTEGWPQDESVFDGADAIVFYCDGGGRHYVNSRLEKTGSLMKKGVGLACLHYGVEVPKGKSGDAFVEWTGGYFETNWSVNPHWTANFKKFPDHPVGRGVKPFSIKDEWYYHMRFREGMKGVTPILSDLPSKDTLKRRDGAHSGNPHVRAAVLERKEPQHVAWASQRPDGGRGFGFTGGHFHRNWQDDNFRKVVLNALVWIAKGEVPAGGVNSATPTSAEMDANQDHHGDLGRRIFHFPADSKERFGQAPAAAPKGATASGKGVKPVFASKLITKATPGHGVEINVDIRGAKELYLVASDAGDYACDWVDWEQPRLVAADGTIKKLTDLKWKTASQAWGETRIDRNAGGGSLRIAGKPVKYGIGTHATSVIGYDLPKGHSFTRFRAKAGLDNGGTDQGACGDQASAQFSVYTSAPTAVVLAKQNAAYVKNSKAAGRGPEEGLAALDVGEGLQAEIFAAEPTILSPSNIDIDHRGRIWVCEIVNYRRHKNKRPEGDRIVILEDTNGDGKADNQKVFYQGRDIDSPHGVCVLATPSGKNTKVIVSAGSKVIVFTDTDGDDKPDSQEDLFTGISGTQHDHGIHAFVFGPDGKLYFNFGNSGRQIKDRNGKPIVDKAGNEVAARRKPYQEGMVFRCNLDGSEFETLGWNFRNNWMATVDSFGSIWQSDNDDDGNRGVRINYVMEFGNYGYKDEFTGAGWKSKRTGMNPQLPWKHWHQNDPGVVPNLLHTGAGSPTGITVYEGDLLPEVFRGQVLHTDAGPNVCRAYPVKPSGAGYIAETVNILTGARDKWFRPSDVAVAPDGSLVVADWYDPGVGGHNMRDLERGRLFRVTPTGHKGYKVPSFDFATPGGAVEALKNSNYAVRYVAWTALKGMGENAHDALRKLGKSENSRYRARALWLMSEIDGQAMSTAYSAAADKDPEIRCVALRIARKHGVRVMQMVETLAGDKSPQVRRECLIALRHDKSSGAPNLWARLAMQHDGKDRWYVEALGIGSDLNADACFAAWLKKVGEKWNTPAGRDIVWRTRSKLALPYLVKILKDPATSQDQHARYMRAFDFHKGPEKDKALQRLLGV